MKTVLFICTGNYYRSRMAEELFRYRTINTDLGWQVQSAGLREDMSKSPNEGTISPHAVRMLRGDGFPIVSQERFPRSVTSNELESSDLLIAMYKSEHKPMFSQRFPEFRDKVSYWDVPDVELMAPPRAYAIIKNNVRELISALKKGTAPRS